MRVRSGFNNNVIEPSASASYLPDTPDFNDATKPWNAKAMVDTSWDSRWSGLMYTSHAKAVRMIVRAL
jgi:hypothetical protein